ncbi:AbrB family transcriptional regulator [Virgibacillus doumboii]|uniref:AbrB family transcriptional regulator n=1 Tax=Virgibacillus doumboii TaxID=2697503 RepID=UPI0013E093EB|nr:AbrB family transcriptional regulator [Virgibacillus doumboii]
MRQHNIAKIIKTIITAIIGGALFKVLQIPVPWLLGPMVAMVIGSNIIKLNFKWPNQFRDAGMIVVGYTIGLSMTSAALQEIARQLPTMFLFTILLMLWCIGIAFIISKISDNDFESALLGSIPGGLTQVILMAEETRGINLAVVTVTQVIRLMMIVITMPLLVMIPIFGEGTAGNSAAVPVAESAGLFPNIIFFAAICIVFAIGGNKIHFPTAYLLGPIIGTAILQLSGITGPTLPSYIISLAQLMIGTHVGLMLQVNQITYKGRTFAIAIGNGVMLMAGSIVLSVGLTWLHHVSNATALLSLAPGGMDQMSIIAHEIHADLAIVSGYQLFRTFFIFFTVAPLLKLFFRVIKRKRNDGKGVYQT